MAKDNMIKPVFDLFEEKTVNVGKIKLNIAQAGKGVPIIMIHGWTNDWRGMAPLGKELFSKMRVILVDLPGYGKSSRLTKYSLEIEAKWIKELKTALGIDRFYLLGHSMGSFVAAKYYQKYSQDLLGLILVSAVFKKKAKKRLIGVAKLMYGWADKHESVQKTLGFIIKQKAYGYLAAWLVNMHKFDRKLIGLYGVTSRKNIDSKAYVEIGEELMSTDTEKLLGGNSIPVLLLYGVYDKICKVSQAKAVVGTSGYQFVEIEEAGHVVTVEQPKKTAQEIWKFVSSGLESNQP